MSDHLKASQKAQNLARIRDNQRRSRARRKEYLQELEIKLRGCEQIGIEASAEIQSAARKVLDENRKLRSLLLERGVSEADIMAALGVSVDKSFDHVSSTAALSNVLEQRTTSRLVTSASSSIPSQPKTASVPRHVPSVSSLSIPSTRPATLSSCEPLSPTSIVSSMGTPPPVSYHAPCYTAPSSLQAPEVKVEDIQYEYPYDPSQNQQWAYPQAYPYSPDPVAYFGASSCVEAANIIRTMHSDASPIHRIDQGCAPLAQPYYNNNHMLYPVATSYPQRLPRI